MSSVWLEGPTVNAVPYRLFVTKGRPKVVAAILFADDKQFYFAFDKDVKNVAKDILLASPFIDKARSRHLVFKHGQRKVRAMGYLVKTGSKYEFDIFTEEVRKLISMTLDRPIKVVKLKSEEEMPETSKKLSDEEKKIFELAPPDLPTELEKELVEESVIETEQDRAQGT